MTSRRQLYMQMRVPGEKSARRVPLCANTLEAARIEMEEVRRKKRTDGLPSTGLRPYFSDYAARYMHFHATATDTGKKPATIAKERYCLTSWIEAVGNVRLDKITRPMIAEFVKKRQEGGIKPRTVNIDVIILRNVLKAAREDGLIATLPTEGIKPKKVITPVRRLLSPADFDRLCSACLSRGGDGQPLKNGQQLQDYLKFLTLCGARRDEALAVRWEDVDFAGKLLCIGANGLTKNGKARSVDFNPDLERHLKSLVSFEKWLHDIDKTPATGWRWRTRGWTNTINIAGRVFVSRAEIERFEQRAAAGEFAKKHQTPNRARPEGRGE